MESTNESALMREHQGTKNNTLHEAFIVSHSGSSVLNKSAVHGDQTFYQWVRSFKTREIDYTLPFYAGDWLMDARHDVNLPKRLTLPVLARYMSGQHQIAGQPHPDKALTAAIAAWCVWNNGGAK